MPDKDDINARSDRARLISEELVQTAEDLIKASRDQRAVGATLVKQLRELAEEIERHQRSKS